MDVKIRVCLPRKYDRLMLFIDNNLLLPGDNNFGNEKNMIVVDNIPLRANRALKMKRACEKPKKFLKLKCLTT
jgi:hypothetical protein